eukprot:1397516-Rhodomonas_salina.1
MMLRNARYWHGVCRVLPCAQYGQVAYGAMRCAVLSQRMVLRDVRAPPGTSLRTSYAMSGTDIAYAATSLRTSYATDIAYATCVQRDVRVWCYAVCGTELAYGATSDRYGHTPPLPPGELSCYEKSLYCPRC